MNPYENDPFFIDKLELLDNDKIFHCPFSCFQPRYFPAAVFHMLFVTPNCLLNVLINEREIKKIIYSYCFPIPAVAPPQPRRPFPAPHEEFCSCVDCSRFHVWCNSNRAGLYCCPGTKYPDALAERSCPIMHNHLAARDYRRTTLCLPTYYCTNCAAGYDYCWICRDVICADDCRCSGAGARRQFVTRGTGMRQVSRLLSCMFCGRFCNYLGQQVPQPLMVNPNLSDEHLAALCNFDENKRDRVY